MFVSLWGDAKGHSNVWEVLVKTLKPATAGNLIEKGEKKGRGGTLQFWKGACRNRNYSLLTGNIYFQIHPTGFENPSLI